MYDYLEALKNNIESWFENESERTLILSEYDSADDLSDDLNDLLFNNDSITGNASGSYTFNSYEAKGYVLDNTDVLREALTGFCVDAETITDHFLNGDFEYFDVIIRCYLLGQAISDFLEEHEEEIEAAIDAAKEEIEA